MALSFQHYDAIVNLLKKSRHDEAEVAVRYLNRYPKSIQFARLLHAALPSWSRVEPRAAQAFVETHVKDSAGTTSLVLQGWAMEDHEEALGMALVKAEELATENVSQTVLFDLYLKGILTGLTDSGQAQTAIDLAQNIELENTRRNLYTVLIQKLGAVHQAEMLQLIEEVPVNKQGLLAQSLMGHSEEWNREGASVEWVLGQEGIDRRDTLLEQGIGHWVYASPDAAEKWVSDHLAVTQDMDGAVRALVRYLKDKEPARAGEWAKRISNPKERQKLAKEVVAESI